VCLTHAAQGATRAGRDPIERGKVPMPAQLAKFGPKGPS
jgi:hypothetical protein